MYAALAAAAAAWYPSPVKIFFKVIVWVDFITDSSHAELLYLLGADSASASVNVACRLAVNVQKQPLKSNHSIIHAF